MSKDFDAVAAARFLADAHNKRARYENLTGALEPPTIADAYRVQEALRPLWEPTRGKIGGLKIATTTKVMQQLMGIDHPCGGMIYGREIYATGHQLRLSAYRHVVVECELAVRVGQTLAKKGQPYTRDDVRAAITGVMPAYELIEDRDAVYRETTAKTLIADNAWNAGIVLGREVPPPPGLLDGIIATLETGVATKTGKTDDPMGALAFIVNLAADRGRPLEAGQVVITGSAIPTLPIALGESFRFTLAGLGAVQMTAVT
jgi:2-keto-4-pentenoate hydratase